jgi:L-asparaginase / beta-aspartyl-peptidase
VVAAVRVLEDDPSTNAGTGAATTSAGTLELDACVMDGASGGSGAVAALPPFRHPIDVARAVLRDGRYHLLCGEGAARFADAAGFAPADPSEMAVARDRGDAGDTVGAVALDRDGGLAAATSTGGLPGKLPGRVGDTPIVGAGTHATTRAACSCTGDGEAFARACAAFWATEHPGGVAEVAEAAVARVRDDFGGLGGLILVDHEGGFAVARSSAHLPHGSVVGDDPVRVGT